MTRTILYLLTFVSMFAQTLASESDVSEGQAAKLCDYYEVASKAGLASSQLALAECYRTGQGRDRDIYKAEELYKMATDDPELGPAALGALGGLYLFEFTCDNVHSDAILILKKAFDQGYRNAGFSLAIAYLNGLYVEKSLNIALDWFSKAAQTQHLVSNAVLYFAYSDQLFGVDRDAALASHYLESLTVMGVNDVGALGEELARDPMLSRYIFSQSSPGSKGQTP